MTHKNPRCSEKKKTERKRKQVTFPKVTFHKKTRFFCNFPSSFQMGCGNSTKTADGTEEQQTNFVKTAVDSALEIC